MKMQTIQLNKDEMFSEEFTLITSEDENYLNEVEVEKEDI